MELTGRPALVLVGVAAAVVAAGGAALAVGVPSAPSHPPEQVVSLPADGHSGATLEIRSGTTLLDVKVANLGGTSGRLLRASVPGGVPVRVTAAGGAGEVSLDGATHTGVGGGSVFATPGWWPGASGAPGAPGFNVDATAGANRVSVTRWGG